MDKIKVTHINPSDTQGGASLAGYRLHKEFLNEENIDSILFVAKQYCLDDKEVIEFRNLFTKIVERIFSKINYYTGLQYLFSINWINLFFNKRFRDSNIFIIRNIHGDYLPLWFPLFLSRFAPVIWRLPDEWAYTGHCTYSYDCKNWKEGCGNCPNLEEYPKLRFDTTRILFKIKKYIYKKSKLYMVGPSTWICDNLKQSPIFKNHSITHIPIGIDTELFKPDIKFKNFSLSFVSFNLNDYRKGGVIIEEIFSKLNNYLVEKSLFLNIYMIGKEVKIKGFSNIQYIFTGYLNENEIVKYYAKTHLNIIPTLADNLPNTILESMSCGTPVVSFDTGGCKDLVKHKETGYLAEHKNIDNFVDGIIFFLENQEELTLYSLNSRNLVEKNFTLELQTKRYLELITKVLNES